MEEEKSTQGGRCRCFGGYEALHFFCGCFRQCRLYGRFRLLLAEVRIQQKTQFDIFLKYFLPLFSIQAPMSRSYTYTGCERAGTVLVVDATTTVRSSLGCSQHECWDVRNIRMASRQDAHSNHSHYAMYAHNRSLHRSAMLRRRPQLLFSVLFSLASSFFLEHFGRKMAHFFRAQLLLLLFCIVCVVFSRFAGVEGREATIYGCT